MAKISNPTSYPTKSPAVGADTVIGTDSEDGNNTKQFPVSGIIDAVANSGDVVTSVTGSSDVSATPTTGDVSVGLTDTGVVAADYDYASVTVDSKGRVTQASTGTPVTSLNTLDGSIGVIAGDGVSVVTSAGDNTITINSTGSGGSGSVTQVLGGTGLDTVPVGGVITTGTINLADTDVAAGEYTNADITVDAQGRITAAANGDGQPNQDLQSVLDTGNSASQNIVLTGVGTSFTATQGSLFVANADWSAIGTGNILRLTGELELGEQLKDFNDSTGTLNQILISDPTLNSGAGGVRWVDQPVLSTRVAVSSASLLALTPASGQDIISAPGAGKSIQIISAAISYDFGTVAYNFTNDLGLFTGTGTAQYTVTAAVMNAPADQFVNLDQASMGPLAANQPLQLRTTGGAATVGDGNATLEVAYRILEV